MLTCLHTITLHFCNLLPPLPHSSRQSLKLHDPLLTRRLLAAGAAPGGGPGRPLIEELLEEWGLLSHMVSLQQVRRGCVEQVGWHACCLKVLPAVNAGTGRLLTPNSPTSPWGKLPAVPVCPTVCACTPLHTPSALQEERRPALCWLFDSAEALLAAGTPPLHDMFYFVTAASWSFPWLGWAGCG